MVSEPAKFQSGVCAGVSGRLLPLVSGSKRPIAVIHDRQLSTQSGQLRQAGGGQKQPVA